MAKEDNEALQTYNMLARGTTVKGDLQTNGNLRIDGEFTGIKNLRIKPTLFTNIIT